MFMRDLSLHILDIMQNSITAGARNIVTRVSACRKLDKLTLSVEDDGCGMDEELLKRVTDPFATTRTTRKVGLGIPLFMESARRSGGTLTIVSVKGKGTTLTADFQISHIDRPPLGDLADTVRAAILSAPDREFKLQLENGSEDFTFDSRMVRQQLGEVPIIEFEVLAWIKDYIEEGIKVIFGGVLDEVNC